MKSRFTGVLHRVLVGQRARQTRTARAGKPQRHSARHRSLPHSREYCTACRRRELRCPRRFPVSAVLPRPREPDGAGGGPIGRFSCRIGRVGGSGMHAGSGAGPAPTLVHLHWRREWDSNPRTVARRWFSRPVQSTTLPSLHRRLDSVVGASVRAVRPWAGAAVFCGLRDCCPQSWRLAVSTALACRLAAWATAGLASDFSPAAAPARSAPARSRGGRHPRARR